MNLDLDMDHTPLTLLHQDGGTWIQVCPGCWGLFQMSPLLTFVWGGGFMWSLPWNPGQPGLCIWASCLHVYIQDRTIKSWKFISSPSKKRTPIVWSFLHIRFEMQGKMKKKSTFEFGYLVQCGFSKDVHCNVHCKSNLIINKLSYPYSCAWLKERFRFT